MQNMQRNAPNNRTLRFHANNPQTREANPDEKGYMVPLVPGADSYRDVAAKRAGFSPAERNRRINNIKRNREIREKKTLVFSSSIARNFNWKKFNEKLNVGSADFHIFKGKKARDITRYMTPHLEEDTPTDVVLIAGGNDLPTTKTSAKTIRNIAGYLIKGGIECKNSGVENVFISSILPRRDANFQLNRLELNTVLREECEKHGFVFLENSNVILKHHIDTDDVHLNLQGTRLLQNNVLNALNA